MKVSIKQLPIGKPVGRDYVAKYMATDWVSVDLSPTDFKDHVSQGKPFCVASLTDGHRITESFAAADLIALDVDAMPDKTPISDGYVADILTDPWVRDHAFLVGDTASSQPNARRLRVLFALDATVTDREVYIGHIRALVEQVGFAVDGQCVDAVRFFYGNQPGKDPVLFRPDNVLPLGKLPPIKPVSPPAVTIDTPELQEVARALTYVEPQPGYDEWLRILMALHSAYPGPDGIAVAEKWSGHVSQPGEIEAKFNSFKRSGITLNTLFKIARDHGYRHPDHKDQPACDLDVERNLLASLLKNNDLLEKRIKPEWFHKPQHRAMYQQMWTLYIKNQYVDKALLKSSMNGQYVDLPDVMVSVDAYIDELHLMYLRRQVYRATGRMESYADSSQEHPDDFLVRLSSMFGELLDYQEHQRGQYVGESDEFERIRHNHEHGIISTGIPTGIDGLDDFENGHLVTLAGYAKAGKSILGLQMARHATDLGHHVVFCTLEMPKREIVRRLIAAETGISTKRQKGKLTDDEVAKINAAEPKIKQRKLYIDDTPTISPSYLQLLVNRLNRQGQPVDLLVVDYVQLMMSDRRIDDPTQRLTDVTRRLKALAMELDIPILIISQLNRESAKASVPSLTHLLQSGSLERDSNAVWALHCPDRDIPTDVDLYILADREGQTDKLPMLLNGPKVTFQRAVTQTISTEGILI